MNWPKLTLTPEDHQKVTDLSAIIKDKADGRDRAMFKEHSEYISVSGIGSELIYIRLLQHAAKCGLPDLQGRWEDESGKGRNFGMDIPEEWVRPVLDLDTEVKCSDKKPEGDRGVLFMRTPSDSGYKKGYFQHLPKAYWEETLPNSYYVLIWKSGKLTYQFVGWTTKERFLQLYHKKGSCEGSQHWEDKLTTNGPGYPTICMHWHNLFCPWEFLKAVRHNRKPRQKPVCPGLGVPV